MQRITDAVKPITDEFEIVLVDDFSPDHSWAVIEQLAEDNPRIKGIKLSRNFGQHYAITAGLDHARGEWVVVMDCDLQDRPEEIPMLYQKAQQGFDIVLARRIDRKDTLLKRLFSKYFYKILSYLTGSEQDETVANLVSITKMWFVPSDRCVSRSAIFQRWCNGSVSGLLKWKCSTTKGSKENQLQP